MGQCHKCGDDCWWNGEEFEGLFRFEGLKWCLHCFQRFCLTEEEEPPYGTDDTMPARDNATASE